MSRINTPLLLSLFYFFFFAFVGVLMIYLPKVLYDIGYSSFEIGVIYAIAPFIRFLMPFFFMRRFRITKKIFVISLVAFFLSTSLYFLSIESFHLFFLNQILLGISVGVVPPYVETLALAHMQKERYGKVRLYGSVGFVLVAIGLADYLEGYSVVLFAFLGLSFATMLTGLIIAYKEHTQEKEVKKEAEDNSGFSLLANWGIWANIFLMQVSFGAFYNFFTIYESEHGISIKAISYLWTFGVVCEIVMLYFQSAILKRYSLLMLIKVSTFVTVFRWLLLFWFPSSLFVSAFSQSFHALSFALYHTAVISYLYHIYPQKTLAQQFYNGFSYGLGMFVGSLIAGYFYGEYLFLVSAIIALAAFLSLYKIPKRSHA